ncbi:MAG: hypothetical protein KKB03_03280 [Nanoarchaeota archaeon]|nr:hypothetical protein [Nanoarchaeota archaeon]MBU1135770.1 hypothetical protein [Nanoarchaeota archaeon]MBU2520238.1 hypothetical protein [Nanoarchaeota archaeon]
MDKLRLVLCPHCDEEHKVILDEVVIRCHKCKNVFEEGSEEHSDEFWHNPNTAVHF